MKKMIFSDETEIEITLNGPTKIVNNNENLIFDEIDKPIFKGGIGETVMEYSGLPTDNNETRSWAIASFEPNGSSNAHYHRERTEDYYIISENAEALITMDGKEYPLTTGEHLKIPANHIHHVLNKSTTEVLSILVKCTPSWIFDDQHIPVDSNLKIVSPTLAGETSGYNDFSTIDSDNL